MMTLQMTAVTMSPVWLEPLLRGLPLLGGPPSSLQEDKYVSRVLIYLRFAATLQMRKILSATAHPLGQMEPVLLSAQMW